MGGGSGSGLVFQLNLGVQIQIKDLATHIHILYVVTLTRHDDGAVVGDAQEEILLKGVVVLFWVDVL